MQDLKDELEIVKEVSGTLHDRGWGPGTTGNLSMLMMVRPDPGPPAPKSFDTGLFLPQLEGKHLLISRSGSSFGSISKQPEEDLGLFRFDRGASSMSLLWGAGPPSSELPTHMMLYAHRWRSINSMIHCHLEEVAVMDRIMERGTEGLPGWIAWVQDIPFGTEELARVTLQEIGERETVCWKGHGVLTASSDLESALKAMELFSEWARSIE